MATAVAAPWVPPVLSTANRRAVPGAAVVEDRFPPDPLITAPPCARHSDIGPVAPLSLPPLFLRILKCYWVWPYSSNR